MNEKNLEDLMDTVEQYVTNLDMRLVELNEQWRLIQDKRVEIKSETTPLHKGTGATTNESKLPELKVPIYDGNSTEYDTFITLFEEIIGNSELSNTAKLIYLQQYLSGDPLTAIQQFITNKDYEGAKNT